MPISLEEFTRAFGVCEFCNLRSTRLCDGILDNGSRCSKKLCRTCAQQVAMVLAQKFGKRLCDSRDLCPDCAAEGRGTDFTPAPAKPAGV